MTNLIDDIQKKILPNVESPLRYSGGELNAVCKDLSAVLVHGCLCFPDLYDLGMSHHGLQILYHIVNNNEKWALSRCFHPWGDAEKAMRNAGTPLFTLEYLSPVMEADWIGFSVQYELQFTNLVNMIDLAGLPVLAADRPHSAPLVIAGGPCMNNPEPLTPFVDAFLVGDGEEAIVEFCAVIEKFKGSGRAKILEEVAKIKGFYIPSRYRYKTAGTFAAPDLGDSEPILPARVKTFDKRHIPAKPIVPLMEVVHHRFAAEVMRGCTRGCRFCSAGMYYRPVREKDIADIKTQVEDGVRGAGWRDVGLLSLSTADYSRVTELLVAMRDVKQAYHLRMSLPSTRIDALTAGQLDELNAVAPITSFTIAPEAASLRLRKVINKDFTDEAIYNTVKLLLERNAQTIKLYFMYGLPTETDEDVQAIIDMVRTISATMRGKSPRLALHVALSPFSPKANTPFQWEGMEAMEKLADKGRFIKRSLSDRKNVKVSYRDGKMTFLETVMARGDRRVGDVILEAWKMGARFDGWDERFNLELWMEAARAACVDLEIYAKSIDANEVLPWCAVSAGVSADFLKKERQLAFEEITTGDCRGGECNNCGACSGELTMRFCTPPSSPEESIYISTANVSPTASAGDTVSYGRRPHTAQEKPAVGHRYRLFFEKAESLRFLGHLDMAAVFHRAMIAAGFPLAFSQGFNPHPRVSFGPPLPFGAIGLNEAFDIETKAPLTGDPIDVNRWLPAGLKVKSCEINNGKGSLSATITASRYRIFPPKSISVETMKEMLDTLNSKTEIIVKREKGGKATEKNIRPAIIKTSVHNNANDNAACGKGTNSHAGLPYFEAILSLSQGGSVSCKPSEFIAALCPEAKISEYLICRVECI